MQKDMLSPQEWVELLHDAAQMDAQAEPIKVHGRIKTRGGAPVHRIPSGLSDVIERLFTQPTPVRLEVAQELMRTADDVALTVLRALAVENRDPDANVRWAIADGLSNVEHPEAVRLLEMLARDDPDETVRTCAIGTLGERALAVYRVRVGEEQATPRALVRTRGAVRTRGVSPIRKVSLEAQTILDLLYNLREEESSEYVKEMTDVTLRQLGE
jgi:hypothetical protein